MIIFGTRSSGARYADCQISCPACNTSNSVEIVYWQEYFHIFWIPFFPLKKHYAGVCTSCKANFSTPHITIPNEARENAKTPKWTFSGLILVGLLICYGAITSSISSHKSKIKTEQITSNPQIGDIYELAYDIEDTSFTSSILGSEDSVKLKKQYTLLKVVSFTEDSIFVLPHQYAVDKASKLYKLKDKEFSTDEYGIFSFSKEEIQNMVKDKTILRVR